MPRALVRVPHEPLLERPLLQVADEVAVSLLLVPALRVLLRRPAAPPPHAAPAVEVAGPVGRRRVVRRAGLQPDRLRRVEVARHPLDGRRDAALLLLHRRRALPASLRRRLLRVHGRLLLLLCDGTVVGWRHLRRHRLAVASCLRGVWRRGAGVRARVRDRLLGAHVRARVRAGGRVHAVVGVHVGLLDVGALRDVRWLLVLAGRHGAVGVLCGRVSLCLCGLGSLLAQGFGLLLLLCPRRRRSCQGARLQVHGRDELTRVLLLRDERVQLGLVR